MVNGKIFVVFVSEIRDLCIMACSLLLGKPPYVGVGCCTLSPEAAGDPSQLAIDTMFKYYSTSMEALSCVSIGEFDKGIVDLFLCCQQSDAQALRELGVEQDKIIILNDAGVPSPRSSLAGYKKTAQKLQSAINIIIPTLSEKMSTAAR